MSGVAYWTYFVVQSTLMDIIGLRQWLEKNDFVKKLISCSFCTGTHIGIYWGLFCFWLNHIQSIWFYVLTIPFTAACVSFLFERFMVFLIDAGVYIDKKNRKE